jgi:hypothetical protein
MHYLTQEETMICKPTLSRLLPLSILHGRSDIPGAVENTPDRGQKAADERTNLTMFKRSMTTLLAAALCGLSLSFLVTPAAQAAVLVTAHTASQPLAIAFFDDGQGSSGLERDGGPWAAQVVAQFTDTDWTVFDNRLLKVFNKGGQQVLGTLCWWNDSKTLFLPHFHLPTLVVDGTIVRNPNDLTQGEANVWISQLFNDGSWLALNVRVQLTFATTP